MTVEPKSRDIILVDLNPIAGREQGGKRPALVVSAPNYRVIPGLFLGIPLTSTQRNLPHHIRIPANRETGLERISFAMTEQIRALSHSRVVRRLGQLDERSFEPVSRYLHLFIA